MSTNNLEAVAETVQSHLTSIHLEVAMLLGTFRNGGVTNQLPQIQNRLACLKEQVAEAENKASHMAMRVRIHNIKEH